MRFAAAAATWLLLLLLPAAMAQSVDYTASTKLTFLAGTRTEKATQQTGPPTGPYQTYASKITLSGPNTTASMSLSSTMTTGANLTATGTTSKPPMNTQPCNSYVEFCTRKYSNITYVGCHNSPFVRPGNSGSNQELPVEDQLEDGVRFLQAQIQWPTNGTEPHFCHTSCDLLDAGPINEWLAKVANWVDKHPYDVVTILLGNGNYSDPSLYVPFIEKSGITKYIYNAPYLPMGLNDWPTLEDMVLRGQRVVMFLDYSANQTKYPWLLDEFSQVWETPFDPEDRAFPCTVQRPPDLKKEDATNRMYIMNHNLNVKFDVFSIDLLVPAVSLLNDTNAASGYGSVGLAANNCRSDWGRAPNVLNVDYYNYGTPPGSVFEAAARVNNVTYKNTCCQTPSDAVSLLSSRTTATQFVALGFACLWLIL